MLLYIYIYLFPVRVKRLSAKTESSTAGDLTFFSADANLLLLLVKKKKNTSTELLPAKNSHAEMYREQALSKKYIHGNTKYLNLTCIEP